MKENGSKFETAKQIFGLVVTAGVGAIVGNIIKHTSPPDMNLIKRACIGVGSLVLTGMVSDKAAEYANGEIDEVVSEIKKMVEQSEDCTDEEEAAG